MPNKGDPFWSYTFGDVDRVSKLLGYCYEHEIMEKLARAGIVHQVGAVHGGHPVYQKSKECINPFLQ